MRTTCSEQSYTHVAVISAYFESKLPRSRTSKLTRIQSIRIIINYQTVDWFPLLGQAAGFPVLGQAQKWKLRPFPVLGLPKSVSKTADAFPVSGRFYFWACTRWQFRFSVRQVRILITNDNVLSAILLL